MMQVTFHTRVPDKAAYACRLLRKAYRSGSRVVVSGPAVRLVGLNSMLWTFDPVDFVPHVLKAAGQPMPPGGAATPICLVPSGDDPPHHEVLVNLGEAMVPGFETFKRVIELVSTETEDATAGRRRWKHYVERGYALVHHEVSA